MNNGVSVDLSLSDALYEAYYEKAPSKKVPAFQFDRTLSVSQNLDQLAVFALHPDATLAVLYSYKPIFLDIVGRWVSNPAKYEEEYAQQGGNTSRIRGSTILHALSRLVGTSSECLSLIEHYVSGEDFCCRLGELSGKKGRSERLELESILLAFYRLVCFDVLTYRQYVSPETLYALLETDGTNLFVAKHLAVHVLCKYLDASEASQSEMLKLHISPESALISVHESDETDYQYLALIEAKRLANFALLGAVSRGSKPPKMVIVDQTDLCPLVTSVCGVLVPNLLSRNTDDGAELDENAFVPTVPSVAVLRRLAENVQNNRPVMLYGKAGAGKTFLINQLARFMAYQDSIVKIHLGEQTDAKLLLGTYTSGEKPGTFQWRLGVLTTAVREGKWVVIEDIDKAPTEVLSVLLTLLEKRELTIPSRGEVIRAKSGFQLISTVRISNDNARNTIPDIIGLRLWRLVGVETPTSADLRNILETKFPLLHSLIGRFIGCYNEVLRIYALPSFIALNRGLHPRVISFRDLMKFCSRCNRLLQNEGVSSPQQLLESSIYDSIFAEAVDCFGSAITEQGALSPLVSAIGEHLEVPSSRISLFLTKHVPGFHNDGNVLRVGRAVLAKSASDRALFARKKTGHSNAFARTNHALRLMEQIGVSVQMAEPVLLVGETGTGKTTVVQQVAQMMSKKLTVINVSQQTEAGDLLGGYKPVNTRTVAMPIQETFEELFAATFSKKKNEKFSLVLSKCIAKNQWKNVARLWGEAVKMAREILAKADESDEETPKKKRRLGLPEKAVLWEKWADFSELAKLFEKHASSLDNAFVFNFVEGALVQAVRNGEWLLLDELNLALADTLESIADLLSETLAQRTVLLSERGDVDAIRAHPDFRLFGCMNPSTDVGKRDLPVSIRLRFSEIYVHSPDGDMADLLAIIDKYIGRYAVGDGTVFSDVAHLYLEAKRLLENNQIVDGANQRPHFSIRTLTRTLVYVCDIVAVYGLRRALYEGFCMSFLTLLDVPSEAVLQPLIQEHTLGGLKNIRLAMGLRPPMPQDGHQYVQFKHYWMRKGPSPVVEQPHYIITPFVEKNLMNLVRASAGRRFPVLVQGPTSAGKTSMIQHLAATTGHTFVRINNHEHTDLQEYLGTYVLDAAGRLVFREGVLVEALRKGHWIVLDELNLAPTDVLEALNRLLDDNRELLIPETGEVVRPHADFMLFATQNPPGLYGGRKVLSRAFRNRFLELHFDDIPEDELEHILRERCLIAPTYAKKIVEVYRQLLVQRQLTRLFEQKKSFATLRDLFRWAKRGAVGYDELAAHGYMLLAERVRRPDERRVVKEVLEKVMRVSLDMDAFYSLLEDKTLVGAADLPVVWTGAMRRLAVLVQAALQHGEPLLLVGETGCGKTTVCEVLTHHWNKRLVAVNAHQNTETGDLVGAQRPVRHRMGLRAALGEALVQIHRAMGVPISGPDKTGSSLEHSGASEKTEDSATADAGGELSSAPVDALLQLYLRYGGPSWAGAPADAVSAVEDARRAAAALFEWHDGPLVQAMRAGEHFLLDEISLADDSVLERLNSVLEPERTLLLAELAGGTVAAEVVAAPGFQFVATMNPGGDYGKKELSPALRNRFTEVWVPTLEDFGDVRQVVAARLSPGRANLAEPMVQFCEWFAARYGGAHSGVLSLRDILAWVQFVNAANASLEDAYLHGACMVFVDALGTNATAHLVAGDLLQQHRTEAVQALSSAMGEDLLARYVARCEISLSPGNLHAGPFAVARDKNARQADFALHAPTTATNAMRVVRALQVSKPILLEGSPGVGKTSLVAALAAATGHPLVRINLSDQTDLVDLFGLDAPAAGGQAGEFSWRDAPFLRAMQRGEWVLLDEMNLALQLVLEGLNACLDHRGTAYIPELDREFVCHADFRVFAAQNPQVQGGGRKGLPKSFVNRFSVVYVDVLQPADLAMIVRYAYPAIEPATADKMVDFVARLDAAVGAGLWGHRGLPWEFNLRDTLRWMGLYATRGIQADMHPADFVGMVACQRFREPLDRQRAADLFSQVFGPRPARDRHFSLGDGFLHAGSALIARRPVLHHPARPLPLQCNFEVLELAVHCVNHRIPLILTGPTNAGKTDVVRFLAGAVGARLVEFAMNSDVDSMDILGGYEQVDLTRAAVALAGEVRHHANFFAVRALALGTPAAAAIRLVRYVDRAGVTANSFAEFHRELHAYAVGQVDPEISALWKRSDTLARRIQHEKSVRFEWFDGLLVQAVQNGHWLVLDNANLCSPSVLDRLNSLLETGGQLVINECSEEDGLARTLTPHPDFRLFLTVDPKYGELSRAMRNRAVEVYLDDLEDRMTTFDRHMLGRPQKSDVKEEPVEDVLTVDSLAVEKLSVENSEELAAKVPAKRRPMAAFVPSYSRPHALLHDAICTENAPTVASAIVAAMSFATAADIVRWHAAISRSLYFSSLEKSVLENVAARAKFLATSGVAESLESAYAPASARASELVGDTTFSTCQLLHPLLNTALLGWMTAPGTALAEPTLLFEAMAAVLSAREAMQRVEDRAVAAKSADLSYLERSAAFALGREIRKVPRLPVYTFVKRVLAFIEAVIATSTSEPVFSSTLLFQALTGLQLLWRNLLDTAHRQNEAQLRTYQELIRAWGATYGHQPFICTHIGELNAAVHAFGEGMVLNTGFSMTPIWEFSRASYASSEKAWEAVAHLAALAKDFDAVSEAQFPEAAASVANLRTSLVSLYKEVVSGTVEQQELVSLLQTLRDGISTLRSISDGFVHPRVHGLRLEFAFLANFVEIYALFNGQDCTSKLLELSTVAGRLTVALARTGRKFRPYPSIFDGLWVFENGSVESRVSGLFTHQLAQLGVSKAASFSKTPGKWLQQKLADYRMLGTQLAANLDALLGDQGAFFSKLLAEWFLHIVDAHGIEKEARNAISEALGGAKFSELHASAIMSGLESVPANFYAICEKYLVPALLLAATGTLLGLGKAWVLFSCGNIQLYVPSLAFDPAIREYVVYKNFSDLKKLAEELANSWRAVQKVHVGDEKTLVERRLPEAENGPEKPRVFRANASIDPLFEDWKAFMDSTIDARPVEALLEAAEKNTASAAKMVDIFHNNSQQFLARLDQNYLVYSDLNDILRGFVGGLKLGYDLVKLGTQKPKYSISTLWPVNVAEIADFKAVIGAFDAARAFSKTLGADLVAAEHVMVFFVKLCFAHRKKMAKNGPDEAKQAEYSSETVLSLALQTLYYRWSLRRLKQEEEAAQEGRLYKYTDPDADIEGDFRALFPDYEDVMEVDGVSKKNDAFEDIYYDIGKLYVDEYVFKKETSISALVDEGAAVTELLAAHNGFQNDPMLSSYVASLIYRLSAAYEGTNSTEDLHFYKGFSVFESRKATTIITAVHLAVLKLLEQWPEHETLKNILVACEEFLMFPLDCPILRLLQKVEQVYTLISEWEKYAASHVTLKVHFDELTGLIVSWRKLELSTWKSLFKAENEVLERNIGKWWFHLFETLVVPDFEDAEVSVEGVFAALNVFMSQTTYGEFTPRLNLLKAFKNHLGAMQSPIYDALANFVVYYEQFLPTIVEKMAATKKKLERDVSEVILLASWKDVNIDALKQSARKSHNSLYKLVRKYRSLLATPVTPIIELGISTETKTVVSLKELISPPALVLETEQNRAVCEGVTTWDSRPARLKNIGVVDRNMEVYVGRIRSEDLPSLYDYTKEVVEEMERLRKETPAELKETNKKEVAALVTQKRRLLSDTLKELRRLGLKTNLRKDIHQIQATVSLIMANTASFEDSLLEGADGHFFRILDLLSRLRAAIQSVAEDVPQMDAEKGLAIVENLVFSLVSSREPLLGLSRAVSEVEHLYYEAADVAALSGCKNSLLKASVVHSAEEKLARIGHLLKWVPRLLDFAAEVVSASGHFEVSGNLTFFYEAKAKMAELATKMPKNTLLTEENGAFIERFGAFFVDFVASMRLWSQTNPNMAFIGDMVLQWIENQRFSATISTSTSLSEVQAVEDVEQAFRELSNSVIVAFQKVVGVQNGAISEKDDGWLVAVQQRIQAYVKSTNHRRVLQKTRKALSVLKKVEYNEKSASLATSLAAFSMPFIRHYFILVQTVLEKARSHYVAVSKLTFVLSSCLYVLATKGFCSPEPPTEQKEDDNLHEGTGLGDGEGAQNNSKDVEEDEDLAEDVQKPNEDQKEKDEDDENDDDAVDMEGDMAGDLEDASDQENDENDDKEEEEMDEEVDDIEDTDPNAIDEKMWDEEAKEDTKEKDSNDANAQNEDDNMQANEDDKPAEKEQKEESKDENGEDEENEKEEEGEDGEENDVGEQDDEVKNDENEQLEEHVPETETLDLPEDMELDGDEDEGDDGEDGEDAMEVDEEKGEEKEEKGEEQQEKTAEEGEEGDEEEGEEQEGEEEENEDGEEDADMDANADPEINEEAMDSEEEALGEKDNEKEEEKPENGDDEPQEQTEGVDGGDESANADMDMDLATRQEAGEKGEGSDNQVIEENQDLGAIGGASSETQQQEEETVKNEDAREQAQESLKQVGDLLKEFHRRREEIKEASQKDENAENAANERPDDFEHVEGENADHDTQALGAADRDQVQSIDEDMAIDDEKEETEGKQEAPENDKTDEEKPETEAEEADPEGDNEGTTRGAFIGERRALQDENDVFSAKKELDEDDMEEETPANEYRVSEHEAGPAMGEEEARELWKRSDQATQELALGLCEQLRLILEPTVATKLRGDYKTGKRLNMKRIIPYIASEFRKDKIWLRRTKPSKREYQVMVAVDDSKSMGESGATELAFHSIALVAKALTQLESGGLLVVRFGEDVKLVHPFEKPFNNYETGPRVFQWFDFQQTRTDIRQLCSQSLQIFEAARLAANSDLWQLQIIVSDGVCEDHATVQRLVRRAREEKVMLVFVVLDGINAGQSILDMSQVSYVTDSAGQMSLKVDKYLDTFPFEYYVVVRNIRELPEMLALILRQYFTEVSSV